MPQKPVKLDPLTAAAQALDSDLRGFEAAVEAVAKLRLDTRKNLERGARELQQASNIYERMQTRVAELGQQLHTAQERAMKAATTLHEIGVGLGRRQGEYLALVADYEKVLSEAVEVRQIAQDRPDAVDEVRDRLASLSERAGAMAAAAQEAGFRDLAEEATARHQQFGALANRLGASA